MYKFWLNTSFLGIIVVGIILILFSISGTSAKESSNVASQPQFTNTIIIFTPTATTPKPTAKQDYVKIKVETDRVEATKLANTTPIPPPPQVYPSDTPRPKISPPTELSGVYELVNGGYSPQSHQPRMASYWHLGTVSTAAQNWWAELYVMSDKDYIGTRVWNTPKTQADMIEEYDKDWTPPEPLGTITITNVTGVKGILTFTSTSGYNGTFDMATETWHIDK